MKLRAIYSNDLERFPRIDFRDGLNVVFAQARDPVVREHDTHGLGKTFLITVLDFALLGSCKKEHPFKVHEDRFAEFVFFLEVETPMGQCVTIRRAVAGTKTISVHTSPFPGQDLRELDPKDWEYSGLGLTKATKLLNELLALSAIAPFRFRKGLGYFLRRQSDYHDEFFISRFGRGRDRDWKPFMALLLGYDHELVTEKYDVDDLQDEKRHDLERSLKSNTNLDELRGVIAIRESEVSKLREQVDEFDFSDIESEITRTTVDEIEMRTADLNQLRYVKTLEVAEIERSLETEFGFEISEVKDIYEAARASLPELLVRQYQELISFNRRVSVDRKKRLGSRLQELRVEISSIEGELYALNVRRKDALAVLAQRETLEKFRSLQAEVLRRESKLIALGQDLRMLDRAEDLRQQLRQIEEDRLRVVARMEAMVRKGSDLYGEIRRIYASMADRILFTPAVLSTGVNTSGNLEFRSRIVEAAASGRETAEGEGATYKKMLCVCFDIALLVAHSDQPFYRFVYHDGVFEGLDNRRKVSLLDTVRDVCASHDVQYILTVIDSDLPRDEQDNRLLFEEDEIVRRLHDQGDDGRLFRMPAF